MSQALTRYAQKLGVMIGFGRSLATLATDDRIRVGCAIFPADCSSVHALGYNGAARGLPHVSPSAEPGTGKSGIAHAEANALVKLNPADVGPCILFCTHLPCSFCAPLVVNSGVIAAVIYDTRYDADPVGERVLRDAGIWILHSGFVELVQQGREEFSDSASLEMLTHLSEMKRMRPVWRKEW